MTGEPLADYIHGPVVSSGDLEAHVRLFSTFGMVEARRQVLTADDCRRQWGLDDHRAIEAVLETPGTRYGARVIQFDPVSSVVVRDPDRGFDADAPKVIDFYAPDFDAACDAVRAAGWSIREPIARYDLPEGCFVEAHVWGPDAVVCAAISGPPDFFARFATVTDRLFSEPQSLSGAVSNLEEAVAFFCDVLGLDVVYRYGIEDDSFRQLVGSARPQFQLRSVNVGRTTEEPYFGLVHYGMPEDAFSSLKGRARPPHRGTLGATIVVRDAVVAASRAAAVGGTVLTDVAITDVAAFGPCRCSTMLAPNGGCYQLVEPRTRR